MLEEAGVLRLALDAGATGHELAELLGVSRSTLHKRLRLLQLSPATRRAIIEGELPVDVAEQLAGRSSEQQADALARLRHAGGTLTVKAALKLVGRARGQ